MINSNEREAFYAEMGFRLKQLRQMKHVSQHELADVLGTVKQTIQKYESGEIRMLPEIIQQFAKVFHVPVGYFYGEDMAKQKFTRVSLMVASEVMRLPSNDIKKNIYSLIRSINENSSQNQE
ncbi:MAG: helix-turn-helix transcriptional regulator [Alphaproteobacteria bacterium]